MMAGGCLAKAAGLSAPFDTGRNVAVRARRVTDRRLTPSANGPIDGLGLNHFNTNFVFFYIIFVVSNAVNSAILLPTHFSALNVNRNRAVLNAVGSVNVVFTLVSGIVFNTLSSSSHDHFNGHAP